jgi:mono/diheme cytochrome c family protein
MNERNKILTPTSANATRLTLCALPLSVAALLTFAWATDASARQKQSARTGASLYRQQCASCHGAKGEGTKAYRKPLLGNQSVGQLASYIAQNMPPGPRKCKAPDAKTIAAYMHDAFYSPVAQARNKPPRVELSRLTVRQYRNAVADLINSFQNVARWDTRRGLNGVYFKTRNIRRGERLLERIDPEIRFDFGTKPPAEGAFVDALERALA